jgi:hypothetical protein
MVGLSVTAAGKAGTIDSAQEPNLLAFVGHRISVQYVEPEGDDVRFDAEYRVRAEVLDLVFGKYGAKQIEFSSYVHIGEPAFGKHQYGLVYLSKYDGRFVQQKYLFQPVYRTSAGRWASCGDPYARISDVHRHGVKAESIAFDPPLTFDVRKGDREQGFPSFQAPFFRIEKNVATCVMGNYPPELFRVMAEGYLKARGVFGPGPESK